jgi:hypothetical protein
MILRSLTKNEKRNSVMPAWIAGIQIRRMRFVGADLRVRPPDGRPHTVAPTRHPCHLDSSAPCWNDTNEELY